MAESFLQVAGNFLPLQEVTNKVILNKMQMQEVCYKDICKLCRLRVVLIKFIFNMNNIV